jgi:hypothetical protein
MDTTSSPITEVLELEASLSFIKRDAGDRWRWETTIYKKEEEH